MNYKNLCICSKGALVVMVTSMLLITTRILAGCLSTNFINSYSYAIFAVIGLHYLSYPLLGLLIEKWMRYKVILVGKILIFVGFFVVIVTLLTLYFVHLNEIPAVGICLVAVFPHLFRHVLFEANVIQFGTDQLQFAPSQQLSSFVYWVLYTSYSLIAFILLMASIITAIVYENIVYFTFTCIFGYGVPVIIIAILSFCCFKHHLVIEPAQCNNPFKLIWRVMRYALTHKQPARRSAFTYGEFPPSRLDLGKERYGGPFTTVQVEDVKSFLYMLSIVLGTFGYGFLDTESKMSEQ